MNGLNIATKIPEPFDPYRPTLPTPSVLAQNLRQLNTLELNMNIMEQNPVSDEELLEKINQVLSESRQDKKKQIAEARQEDTSSEKFHDVYETSEQESTDGKQSEVKSFGEQKSLVLENHYLSLQLQAEKKKAKDLQSKFKLFENSVKYFERLNGQLEKIKQAVDDDSIEIDREEFEKIGSDTMQKIRLKTIHTAASGLMNPVAANDMVKEVASFCEPCGNEESPNKMKEDGEEVAFRDAEDFKQLEQGLEIVRDKTVDPDIDAEKVFITKTEKRCLEDIGNLAARTRAPLDDKHQRYFERDRRRFANSIVMPEIQEVEKVENVPLEIISKTRETPVNITSTELDGLKSYLLQLKELIARRETAWARTTERDYNQRVEITRFKNEVSHLRMLCEKRQKDLKERDQIISAKDEEIRELQKRIQGLRNAIMKLEKKDDRIMDTIDGMTNEVLENSQIVQRSYNAMKRQSMMNRSNAPNSISIMTTKQPANVTSAKPSSGSKDVISRKSKYVTEKISLRKVKGSESVTNEGEGKPFSDKKQKPSPKEKPKTRHRADSLHKTKETFDRVDEKLQKVEEMLHNEVLKGKKSSHKPTRNQTELKSLLRSSATEKLISDFPSAKKQSLSNSTMRQEMLTAMTGLHGTSSLGLKTGAFPEPKKNQPTAAVIANALLAARNANVFNY